MNLSTPKLQYTLRRAKTLFRIIMVGYGWVWLDMVRYGSVWLGMVGYGWVWLGMSEDCVPLCWSPSTSIHYHYEPHLPLTQKNGQWPPRPQHVYAVNLCTRLLGEGGYPSTHTLVVVVVVVVVVVFVVELILRWIIWHSTNRRRRGRRRHEPSYACHFSIQQSNRSAEAGSFDTL